MRWLLAGLVISGCSPTAMEFERFNARTQEDCGSFVIRRSACPQGIPEISECMNAALQAGGAAKVSWTVFSVEGDPIVSTLFTGGETSMTLFVDTRADAFGPREVQVRHCAATSLTVAPVEGCPLLDFGECTQAK